MRDDIRKVPIHHRPRSIDAVNERLASEDEPRTLHPTKGFRRLSSRRSRAEQVVSLMKNGARPWGLPALRRFISD